MAIYTNDTTGSIFTLIEKGGQQGGNIRKIVVTNRSGQDAIVSIYLDDDTNLFYFAFKVNAPSGTGFVLSDNLSFNKDTYALKAVNVGSSPNIDVIIE